MVTAHSMVDPAERIATLRSRCLQRKRLVASVEGDPRVTARSLRASEHVASWQVRRGLLARDHLAAIPLDLDDLELLVGRLAPVPPGHGGVEAALAYLREHCPHISTPGQTGHCELHLSRLYARGIGGLSEDIRLLASRDGSDSRHAEAYQSFLYALEGLSSLCQNAAALADMQRGTASDARRAELDATAESCRRIASEPPATFRDALQLLWFVIVGCLVADRAWLVCPGHLDRTLWPFYRADVEAGRLTKGEALLLLECLYLLLNEFIPDGLAISVMVGGRDSFGCDVTNELSYLCLEALRRTRLIYPTVGLCWNEGTPGDLVELAVELIGLGVKNPAFFGDETIQRGLRTYGVPPEEACTYVNSTCVEITPVGSSNVWVASPYFSLCGILLDEIAGQAVGLAAETFDDFVVCYCQRLAHHITVAVAVENENRLQRRRYGRKPLQSVFTRDCIERGQDIDDSGARYNWVECSFVGLANLADSLSVIEQEVYPRGRLSIAGLYRILDADFQGYEAERERFLHAYPKYGNDCPAADNRIGEIIQFVRAECAKHRMAPDDSPFVPGAFCWIMHEQLGRACGATPDGRRAGFPFADGCGPAQGRERLGPTAAVLSVTSWDPAPLIGGAAFNMKFNTSLFSSRDATRRLKDLIVTFLRRGGFEIQVNVLDHQILQEARQRPESHQDLVVRIGGYTDYFTRLSSQMQEEIIMRTEYGEL